MSICKDGLIDLTAHRKWSQTGGGAPRSRTAGHASRRRLSRPGL